MLLPTQTWRTIATDSSSPSRSPTLISYKYRHVLCVTLKELTALRAKIFYCQDIHSVQTPNMLLATMLAALAAALPIATALDIDVDDPASIRAASQSLAFGLQSFYQNNMSNTASTAIGTLPAPLYWWQAGAMWGGMVDYWAYTNDSSYNAVITQALLAQVGPDWNYMPPAYFASLGNDDQV